MKSSLLASPVAKSSTLGTWTAVAALGAAGASTAHAAIVNFDTPITLHNSDTWYLDNTPTSYALGQVDIQTSLSFGYFPNDRYSYGTHPELFAQDATNIVIQFQPGDTINDAVFVGSRTAALDWNHGPNGVNAGPIWNSFTIGTPGYFAFKFNDGDGIRYGWASITIGEFTSGVTINSWAYESTVGQSINVAAVPEPSSLALGGLGLLAAGVAGLRAYKRREVSAGA